VGIYPGFFFFLGDLPWLGEPDHSSSSIVSLAGLLSSPSPWLLYIPNVGALGISSGKRRAFSMKEQGLISFFLIF
jgi:hypothetical protein